MIKEIIRKVVPSNFYIFCSTLKCEYKYLFLIKKVFRKGWCTFFVDYINNKYDLFEEAEIHHVYYHGHKLFYRTKSTDILLISLILIENKQYNLDLGRFAINGILDLGANIGLFTLKFASLFPNTKFIAVEPEKENYKLLRMNLEQYPNCVFVNKGIWWRNSKLEIVDVGEGAWAFQVIESETGSINAVSIDHLCDEYNILPSLIKMDIEGSEMMIFKHLDSFRRMKDNSIFIIETHEQIVPGVDILVRNTMKINNYSETKMYEDYVFQRI